jgi:hypothetical protein
MINSFRCLVNTALICVVMLSVILLLIVALRIEERQGRRQFIYLFILEFFIIFYFWNFFSNILKPRNFEQITAPSLSLKFLISVRSST